MRCTTINQTNHPNQTAMKSKENIENAANAENRENLGNIEIADSEPDTSKTHGALRSFILKSRMAASEFFS